MRQFILFLVLTACTLSCSNKNKNQKIKSAEWLVGQWAHRSKEGVLSETWTKPTDSTLVGSSFFIKGKDTLHFEYMVLKVTEGELAYETRIKGQNNDQPIVFSLVSETENEFVFENLQNEYPQKIKYQRNSANSILLFIAGVQAKKTFSEQFKMTKIN